MAGGGGVMATIFAVDGDKATLSVYREALVMMNHSVVGEAADSHEALRIYRKMERFPDFVLMDYRTTHANDIEAMHEMRRINPEQCLILVTSDRKAACEIKSMGANTFVLKPFRLAALSAIINNALVSRQRKEKTA